MNNQPIDTAQDADIRLSAQAMRRAAQRAWALAEQTGTAIVISRKGVIEQITPKGTSAIEGVQEAIPPYGDKS